MNTDQLLHRSQSARALYDKLRQRDIQLSLHANGHDLCFDAPTGAFDEALKSETRDLKAEIAALLRDGFDTPTPTPTPTQQPPETGPGPVIKSFPAHPAIEGQWIARRDQPPSTNYHIVTNVPLPADVKFDAVRDAIARIVKRHDTLRSTFAEQDGQLFQRVHAHMPVHVRKINKIIEIQNDLFDIATGPLARFGYIASGENGSPQLIISIDHLCFDGQSIALLHKEICADLAGKTAPQTPNIEQIARNAHHALAGARGAQIREFWSPRTDKLLSTGLPTDPAADKNGGGKRLLIELVGKDALAFETLIKHARKTTQTTLWTALSIAMIARHKENGTAVIGLPFAGRRDPETMRAMGCYVNVLPVAITPDMNANIDTLIKQVGHEILSVLDVQDYPLSRLTHDITRAAQGPTGDPFDAVNILEISDNEQLIEDDEFGAGKFPLMIGLIKGGTHSMLALEYQSNIFGPDWIKRFADRFLTFVHALARNPEMPIGQVDLIPDDERDLLTIALNDTASDYPRDCGLGELLARQIANPANANRIALQDHDHKITYAQLGQQVRSIATGLGALGVAPGDIVALAAERSIESILTLLGIAWQGAAYLPIDKSMPGDAIVALMDDCGAKTLLCDSFEMDRLSNITGDIRLAPLPDRKSKGKTDTPPAKRTGDDLAYVMFTSGSTGKPKGVLIPNRAGARLVLNNKSLDFDHRDVMAQAASLGFDAATLEIWAPLLNGGRLVIIDNDTLFDPDALRDALVNGDVTTMWLTASLFNRIADDAPHCFAPLKRLLSGGEALSPLHLQKVMAACPNLHLINGYGPTENTTFTCTHPITSADANADNVPIGKPLGNTRVYVLDARQKIAPIGVWGELYAAGDGLARGYCGAAGLTDAAFVKIDHLGEDRLYKTGDRVRWRAEGVLEFGGRGDGQVKIRGHRIETAAIEKHLCDLDGIRNACVMPMGTGADAFLAAVIAASRDDSAIWMAQLGRILPDYMVPERVVILDHLPVNVNGKVDRKKIALAIADASPVPHDVATSTTSHFEQLVTDQFKSLFANAQITPTSDFFALGGHSLVAMRLAGLIEKTTGFRPKLQDIFIARTVAGIASLISQQVGTAPQSLIPVAAGQKFPLSSGQARLWVLQRMQPDIAVYSVPAAFEIQGPIDADALQSALHRLEDRQHALRLRFKSDPHHPDGVSQYLVPAGSWQLGRHTMDEQTARQFIARETMRPFDLENKPLARADLITIAPDRHWMMVSLHHAICDGWSMPTLLHDLAAFYSAQIGGAEPTLSPIARHYEDFASWQRSYLQSTTGKQLLDRWKTRLLPLPEPLALPTDRRRPKARRFAGDFLDVTFGNRTTRAIEDAATRHGTTAFSILTALVQILMHRQCNQTDIALGMLVAGRDQAALDDVVGFFVNTVVIRQNVDPDAVFDNHLAQTGKTIIDALSDQAVPFEDVVAAVNAPRDPARNPLFDVLVAWQDSLPDLGKLGPASLSLLTADFPFSKFDLAFYFCKRGDALCTQIEFDTDLFDTSTIQAFFDRLETLATAALATAAQTKIAQLPILASGELARIDHFNATTRDLAIDRSISEPFIDQVRKTPNASAVIGTSETLSYTQFARRAAGIAKRLRMASVKPGDVIGVAIRRSTDMLAAIHGILLAGAAYSPLDPDHPQQRRTDMLDDLGYPRVITTADLAHLFDADAVIILDGNEDADIPDPIHAPDSLAYVLFTSGSTGRPKGVELAHRGILNRILWMQDAFPLGPDDVILQKTPITFDVSVWELFWWSWTGARVVLPDPGVERDPQQLAQTIHDHRVTTMHFVPSMLASFLFSIENNLVDLENLRSLRRVFASGEALDPALVKRFNDLLFAKFGTELHNLYGPTEATVDVTWHACSPLENPDLVPIGKPIANTSIRIFDPNLNDVPIGVAGEIVLGGPQIALGYRNRPELSAEKFPDDPRHPGQRIYRTGDLGRFLADGAVEYLGRMDHQVKIRGFRIECGEVETGLENHDLVERALVMAVRVGDLDELHAFVLGDDDLTTSILRDHLRSRLPEYMIPARFFTLDHLPLTSSGKVDRKALSGTPMAGSPKTPRKTPAPNNTATANANAAITKSEPGDELAKLERSLQRLWQEIIPGILAERDDGFFEIGGNSLLLLRLHEKINTRWPGKVGIADLFANATIARQAELLANGNVVEDDLATAHDDALAIDEPIAVIGIGLQLAGADDIDSFWHDVANGTDHVRPLPTDRDAQTRDMLSALGRPVPAHFRQAAYLDRIFDFDPARFRMAPADAALLDPEQRLFIETALMAMENAGYGGQALRGRKVGIFAGGGANPAWRMAMEHISRDKAEQVFALNVPSNMVTRLSFLKDWHGPANIVDTACSSSLVAVHQACQNLRNGTCQIALAGGAKLIPCPPDAKGGFTIDSSTARTRAFDNTADGTGMGEGSVVLVLKPLGAAMADGDPVYAIIRGSAVNQDGASSGAAAPNPAMQADVIKQAARAADIDLASLSYIEAHGTGTSLGDPIEIDGLTRAFAGACDETGFALIGSGKGNYGHLDGAAGALGLARAIMALRFDQAPPQPFFDTPNSKIDFSRAPVRVAKHLEPLPDRGAPRRAGVSSFGLSGINAHIILEAAPQRGAFANTTITANTANDARQTNAAYVIALSAANETTLRDYATRLHRVIAQKPNLDRADIRDISHTLIIGRDVLKHRFAIAVSDRDGLLDGLSRLIAGDQTNCAAPKPQQTPTIAASTPHRTDASAHARQWLDGANLIWPADHKAGKVSLPHAPFAKMLCKPVFGTKTKTVASPDTSILTGPVDTEKGRCFAIPVGDPAFWPTREHHLNGQPTLVGMAVPSLIAQAVRNGRSAPPVVRISNLKWQKALIANALPDGTATLVLHDDGNVELGGRLKNGKWSVFATAQQTSEAAPSHIIPTDQSARTNRTGDGDARDTHTNANSPANNYGGTSTNTNNTGYGNTTDHANANSTDDGTSTVNTTDHASSSDYANANNTGYGNSTINTTDHTSSNGSDYASGNGSNNANSNSNGDNGYANSNKDAASNTDATSYAAPRKAPLLPSLADFRARCTVRVDIAAHHNQIGPITISDRWDCRQSMHYDPARTIAISQLKLKPQYHDDLDQWVIHPALADIACSMLLTATDNGSVPIGADQITVHAPLTENIVICVHRHPDGVADFTFFDAQSEQLLLTLYGLHFAFPDGARTDTKAPDLSPELLKIIWQPSPVATVPIPANCMMITDGDFWPVPQGCQTLDPNAVSREILVATDTLILALQPGNDLALRTAQALRSILRHMRRHLRLVVVGTGAFHIGSPFPLTDRNMIAQTGTDTGSGTVKAAGAGDEATAFTHTGTGTGTSTGADIGTDKNTTALSSPIDPNQTAAAGVAMAAAQEEPRLALSFADIARDEFLSHIGAALHSAPTRDPVSVYRHQTRYHRKLTPLSNADTLFNSATTPLGAPNSAPLNSGTPNTAATDTDTNRPKSSWPDHGVCVVTGGTGGFALSLAEEMAAGGKVKLALISRTGISGTTATDGNTAQSQIAALRAKGIDISLFACDVADQAALSDTLDQIRNTLGPITAIAHAAGLADGGFLAIRDMAAFDAIMAAKIDGARHLDALTLNDPVQAFVMFGSLTAMIGVPGQSAYSAANAFLDGFAYYRRSHGRPAITIDWCALRDQGMAARHNVAFQPGATISPDQAPIFWRNALCSTAEQLIVLAPALAGDAIEKPDQTKDTAPRPAPKADAAATHPQITLPASTPPTASIAPTAPVTLDITSQIAAIWAETLGYDSIAPDDDFFALGGDSITGMQIIDRINDELNVSLAISDLFATPTLSEFTSRYIPMNIAGKTPSSSPMISPDQNGPDNLPNLNNVPDHSEKVFNPTLQIQHIWAEVLGYETIDPDDDFYALGGDSITGMQIIERINATFESDLSLADLFETPTIDALNAKIKGNPTVSTAPAATIVQELSPAQAPNPEPEPEPVPDDPRRAPMLDFYPLALEQISVLHAEHSGNMGTAFNLPHVFVLDNSIDFNQLRQAISRLIDHHEILRTRLIATGDDWRMQILAAKDALPDLTPIKLDTSVPLETACARFVTPFNLETELPIRWHLLHGKDRQKVLFFDIHHALADGFTTEVLFSDLFAFYRGNAPQALKYQLRDYAYWSHQPENRKRLADARDYWQALYQGPLPKLDLPSDHRRPAFHSFNGGMAGFELDHNLLKSARKFAAGQRVTMFTLVLGTWFAVLSRLSAQDDLVISVPVDQRDGAGYRNLPGMMVSLLPLRMQISGDDTVKTLLRKVQNHHVDAMRHRAYFLDQLLNDLAPPAAPDRTLLSEVSLSYMNYAQGGTGTGPDQNTDDLRLIGLGRAQCKNDIGIFVRDLPDSMAITFDYYADMFDQERMVELGKVFTTTLENLIATDHTPIADIDLLPDEQHAKIAVWEQGPQPDISFETRTNDGIFALFAQQASRIPDHPAIQDRDGVWNFAKLNAQADAIAHCLQIAGVKQGDLVAMHIERGAHAVAAILGITALGAGYVPLDPAYPATRNSFILRDSGAKLVLIDDGGQHALASIGNQTARQINIAEIAPALGKFTPPRLTAPNSAPAYMMYTSGSTGTPKGVLIEQRAVLRLALGEDYAKIGPDDVVAQAGPLAFDASTFEIWVTLLRGAQIAVIDRNDLLDPVKFAEALRRFAVSKMFMSVGLFNRQIDHDPQSLGGLKTLMIGGDAISKSHVRNFISQCPNVTVLNGYGPTESTTFAVVGPITRDDLSGDTDNTILGRPIGFTKTLIVDGNGKPAPIGVWGELLIGGARLAREYWQRPELTRERFIPDPDQPGERLYRSGDLARWTLDGRIEFGGRRDNQIKLRGFRIELDEIEQQLLSAPDMRNAIVLFDAKAPDGGAIIACVQIGQPGTATNLNDADIRTMAEWLGGRLPGYMIPSKWYIVDTIPITANGKVDRKALLETVRVQANILTLENGAGTPPVNAAETLIADIFTEVFGTPIRDRHASFALLGGHSLMAIRIVNRIADHIGKRIGMADFFADPTVMGLARHIDSVQGNVPFAATQNQIPTAPDMAFYPASNAQKRLYLLSQMEGNNGAYGMLFVFRCTGDLRVAPLQTALTKLVARHETLRTGFEERNGVITQKIHAITTPVVAFDDLSGHSDPAREALRLTRHEAATPIILDQPPLIRARVIKVAENENLLVLMTHHIVGDGWSSRILIDELGAFYDGAVRNQDDRLAPLPITYKDFAHWQSKQDWQAAGAYWCHQLAGAPEQINLPTDRPIPETQSFRGAHAHHALPAEVLQGLHALARKHKTTLSSVGMALFSAMLYRLTRQSDMVIGMGVAGRERTETEGLIGFFVNVLPIRIHLDDDTDLGNLITAIHTNIADALDRQDYPFDELVRAVAPKRKSNRQPLVNVVFEYQRFEAVPASDKHRGLPQIAPETPGLLPANLDTFVDNTTAKHDIILFLTEEAGQARFTLEYDTDLFDADTMQRWLSFLAKFAGAAAQNAQRDSE
ncbi:amino acid adenylation domain-containing protein [Thalassospira alkalitolerans]|uniref:amino acid adenylation domain-containing protein n=1 Tax=Thalassospira alkalitolerans TaxID=1293890 RepID=UPI003AA7FC37